MPTATAASSAKVADPFEGIDLGTLERSLAKPRNLFGFALTGLITLLTLIAIFPLFSVLITLIIRGGSRLSVELFTSLPPAAFEEGGGIGNAILGTLAMVGMAALISIPIGILAAVYLAEIGPQTRFAQAIRFSAKILTGFPSVLAGVFAYGAVVMLTGSFSAIAGALALSVLMIPTILLTAEESIRMVPDRMRQAAIGMGTTNFQTVRLVLLPTAFPGILTGVMLAIARAAGETAPLLFTALFSNDWLNAGGRVQLNQPTASLAVLIYNFSSQPFENLIEIAWAAALVLVLLVLTTNLIGQSLAPRQVRN